MLRLCRKMLRGRIPSLPTQQEPAVTAINGRTSQSAQSLVMLSSSSVQRLGLRDAKGEEFAPARTALSGLILESALTLEMSLKPNVGPQDSKNAERGSTAHAMTVLCGVLGLLAMVSAPSVRGDAWSRDGPLVPNRSAALLMTSHRRRLTAQHTALVISMVKRPQRLLLLFLFKPNPLPTLVWEVVRCCSLPRPSVSSFHSLPSLFSLLFDLVNNPNWMLLTSSKLSGIHQHTDGNVRSLCSLILVLLSAVHTQSHDCSSASNIFVQYLFPSSLPCSLIQLKLNLQSVSFPFNSNSFYSLLDFRVVVLLLHPAVCFRPVCFLPMVVAHL
jgi:hypothetical protein